MAALAGLEAGMFGGAAALLFLLVTAVWRHQPWWSTPNLLASLLYGERAFRSGLGTVTISGIAMHFTASGLIGAVFGLVFGAIRSPVRLFFLGVLAGLVWFYLFPSLWPGLTGPRLARYIAYPSTFWADILFGSCLARTRGFLRALEGVPSPTPTVPDASSTPPQNIH